MNNFFQNKKIQLLLVFLISFGFFLLLQFFTPNLFGNDTFYHIKCADLIKSGGIIKDFPWLKFTILHNSQYIDHHLLFHFFLVPFLSLGLIAGPKIACALSASLIFALFFLFLDSQKIKAKFLWTVILLFGSYPFILRLNLIRAQDFSLVFLISGLYFIFKRKYFWLSIISFFYVWLYGGFVLLPFLALLYSLIFYLCSKKGNSLFVFLSSFLGTILGLVINPYFPKNIYFLLVQIFKVSFSPVSIPKGAEWYPLEFSSVLGFLIPFLLFVASIASVLIFYVKRISIETRPKQVWDSNISPAWSPQLVEEKKGEIQKIYFLGLASIVMFIATILSQRFIEYFIPLSILFSAFSFDYYLKHINLPDFSRVLDSPLKWGKLIKDKASLVLLGLFVFVLTFFILNVQKSTKTLASTSPYNKYKEASQWLAQNTPKGSIVFNVNWGDFPQLFFWNDHNYYVVGLDPTFMYEYNKYLYEKWVSIQKGENLDKAAQIIREDFDSEYIFLSERNKELAEKLDKREDFEKVYKDKETKIYKLKN